MAETWVINEVPALPLTGINTIFNVNFNSNNSSFTRLTLMSYEDEGMYSTAIYYGTQSLDVFNGLSLDVPINMWADQAYRTVTFDEALTGDLLTWFQANATKQADPSPAYPKINSFTYHGKQINNINGKPIRYVHHSGNTYEMVYLDANGNYLRDVNGYVLQDSDGNYLEFTEALKKTKRVNNIL